MSELSIQKRQSGEVTIVDLSGKIALGESNRALHDEIRELTGSGQKKILLNLANVTVIDSSGLGELVASYASVERNGGTLKLSNLSDRFIELITITKLYTVFDVFDNEADALASFGSASEAAA
ncbi:MAG: STAS domain-containing protein [Pyrinomonadaceae bacterium]